MATRLNAEAPDFEAAFEALAAARGETAPDRREQVAAILARVREAGDAALIELTRHFDRVDLAPDDLRVKGEEIEQARGASAPEALAALRFAAERIRGFHELQMPEPVRQTEPSGVARGLRWRPLAAVGLYVPGGTAAYPSSVLMNALPAKVAGCGRLVMTVPAPDGRIEPLVLAAAELAGVDEIYKVGGAQAIAALAYGTASIAPVDKIVGPGNAFVAEAKRQVFGKVGIDMVAGPSEVVIVAQKVCDPAWIAADLLSQAEHDADAQSILLTDDAGFADAVVQAVEQQLGTLERQDIATASWERHGAVVVVRAIEDAIPLVDRLAPEHLQLIGSRAEAMFERVAHAGSVFLGAFTPEVIGDYVGGPNHVLPTARTARFASGLSVHDFLKRTTWLACTERGFAELAPAAATLARAEGLGAHARAVSIRASAAS